MKDIKKFISHLHTSKKKNLTKKKIHYSSKFSLLEIKVSCIFRIWIKLFFHFNSILVFYCYIKNYHKLSSLNNTCLLSHSVCVSEFWARVVWCLTRSYSAAIIVLIPSRALWGSWAQRLSVSPISLITGNSLHSASMTFPEFQLTSSC